MAAHMTGHRFYILDVFAAAKYAGNQLVVVRDAASLSEAQMQDIAREMNYSETTFITSETPRDGGYDVRIFTPKVEIPFAGHPTLGTAWVVGHEIVGGGFDTVRLNLAVGQVPVRFESSDGRRETVWMAPGAPEFGATVPVEKIARVISLAPDEIDTRFPVQEVTIGISFILVPLKSLRALGKSHLDRKAYSALIESGYPGAIFLFSPETREADNRLSARMYADAYGVAEDPATGSASACLAAYLTKHGYFPGHLEEVRVEQGYEMGRPSLLRLRSQRTTDTIEVEVGGSVVLIGRGELT
jgi:trans-2,3-dihydro-3-hydroxyanthranilate isomerase